MAGHHAESVLKSINQRRRDDRYCDFKVRVGEKSFPVHRLVLDSCSEYFRGMFASNMAEATQGYVIVRDANEQAVEICIDFMYYGKANLDMQNVAGVLHMATLWDLEGLGKICNDFLNKNISIQTCFHVKKLAAAYQLEELEKVCNNFIASHIKQLSTEGFFSDLNSVDVSRCLVDVKAIFLKSHGSISPNRARLLWNFVQAWSDAFQQSPEGLCQAMQEIPIGRLRMNIIRNQVWKNAHVIACEECKSFIANKTLGLWTESDITGVDKSSYIFLKSLAKTYQFQKIESHMDQCIINDFENLSRGKDFRQLPEDDFLQYLRSDKLFGIPLDRLAGIILNWIHYDVGRMSQFEELEPIFYLFNEGDVEERSDAESADESNGVVEEDIEYLYHSCDRYFEYEGDLAWSTGPIDADEPIEEDMTDFDLAPMILCMKAFGKKHGCHMIESRADDMILQEFHHVVSNSEWKNVERDDVHRYLNSSKLNRDNVQAIWKAILDWVKHDAEHRATYFPDLFKVCTLENATPKFLREVVLVEPLVKNSEECKDTMISIMLRQNERFQTETAENEKKLKEEMNKLKKRLEAVESSLKPASRGKQPLQSPFRKYSKQFQNYSH